MKQIPKCVAFISLVLLVNLTVSPQNLIFGEYRRNEYPSGYVILGLDYTFKFRFHFDLQWDLACGTYSTKGDTVYFNYQSDMYDPICNNQGINVTDTSGVILQDAIDTRYRPITAYVSRDKLKTIVVSGPSIDQDTLVNEVNVYHRLKAKEITVRRPSFNGRLHDGIYLVKFESPVRQKYRLLIQGDSYALFEGQHLKSSGKITWVSNDSFALGIDDTKPESSDLFSKMHNGWGNPCYEIGPNGRNFRLTWSGNLHVTAGEGKIVRESIR